MSIIGERTAHRQTVAMDGLGLAVLQLFEPPLDGAHPTHLLLELGFGMPVRLKDRFGRFTQIMELTELMRHTRQALGDRLANGLLAVRDPPLDGDGERFFDLTE